MWLQQLPEALRWTLLFVIGASLGSLLNLAIYRLAHFVNRNVSPWSLPPSADRPRTLRDRIPVLGWIFLGRESDVYGKGHWIRPLLIELGCAAGLAWFADWNLNGGLYGGESVRLVTGQAALAGSLNSAWFLFHSVLLALMVVATFIDFDEQMIPDWVTVPGTVFALLCYSILPSLRLPVVQREVLAARLQFLDYWSPGDANTWHEGPWGLLAAVAIVLIWCLALLPKTTTLRQGLWRGIRIMIASILRPPRNTTASVPRVQPRRMLTETKVLFWLAVALGLFVFAMYTAVGGDRWTALTDALLGLAMGGGIVWAVRIIAGRALGVEAMGFGDVTLMCMIGAFLGWQPALLAFVIAPFTSIVVALAQLLLRGENRLAFGPYLCLGTVIVLVGWNFVWNQWAAHGVFVMGGTFLIAVIVVCLVLMALMLTGLGWIRQRVG
jgi:prepilin signal peptidase PulO-like enzyme (type II secretory pathway)